MAGKMVIVLGRGHSATRLISQTLVEGGFFMGENLNESFDKVPAQYMYQAGKLSCSLVPYLGDGEWSFDSLFNTAPSRGWEAYMKLYLSDVLESPKDLVGWKLPETILSAPWIMKMFPDAYYIYWVRHPFDNMMGAHLTDNIGAFGIAPPTGDVLMDRALSYKFQYDIIFKNTLPKNFIQIRMEDFILDQEKTLKDLSGYLGVELPSLYVNQDVVGRWERLTEQEAGVLDFEFLHESMNNLKYRRKKS